MSFSKLNPVVEAFAPRDRLAITRRAMVGLARIATAIRQNPGTGQTRRLVRFVAGCYNGGHFPFDLAELRALDDELAEACIDYLDYDRLGVREIHLHLPGGGAELHGWLRDYGMLDKACGEG